MPGWKIVGVVVLGLGSVACGGSDPVARRVAQAQVLADVVCECPAALGVTTEAECRENVEVIAITENEEVCVRRVYDAHQAELLPVFDCAADALDEYTECLRGVLEMCPPDNVEVGQCSMAFDSAQDACPTPSTQAQAELSACFASRT